MKKYIEAIEDTEEREKDFIQEEVKPTETQVGENIEITFSKLEEDKSLEKVKAKEKSGKTYNYRKHFCYHDEEPNKSCTVEKI